MYYIFADSGEFICDYEKVEEALGRQSRMSEPTLVLYSTSPNCEDAWEHGIEVMAPSPQKHGFYYSFSPPMGGYIHRNFENLEEALEKLKADREEYPKGFFPDRIEERITITHKVKL